MLWVEKLGLTIWARHLSFKMSRPSKRFAHSPVYCGLDILLLAVKWLESKGTTISPPSAEGKNERKYTSAPERKNFTLPLSRPDSFRRDFFCLTILLPVISKTSLVKGFTSLRSDLQKKLKASCRHHIFRVFNM